MLISIYKKIKKSIFLSFIKSEEHEIHQEVIKHVYVSYKMFFLKFF